MVEGLVVVQMMVHDVLVFVEGNTVIVWLCKWHFVVIVKAVICWVTLKVVWQLMVIVRVLLVTV